MLTDTEVADTARELLAEEMDGLAPPAALLSTVRARHAARRRMRRAAAGTMAGVAAGVTAAAVASATATGPERTPPVAAGARAARTGGASAKVPAMQTISLDGYTIGVRAPVHAVTGPHGHLIEFTFASPDVHRHGAPTTSAFAFHFMLAGRIPPAAVAIRVPGRHAPGYLLRTSRKVTLYLPFPVADGRSHSLMLWAAPRDEASVLRIASALTLHLGPALRAATATP
jgi:hypothetical protein